LLRLEFAPVVVRIEDGIEKAVSRSEAANGAADRTLELPECRGDCLFAAHVEWVPQRLDSSLPDAIPNIAPALLDAPTAFGRA
jgi:hypothetical protein